MPLIEPMTPAFASYLSDESRTQGQAEYIAFPRSEEEIAQVLRWCAQHGVPVTAQGGMTGLAGGASPQGGLALNLSRMDRILGLRRDSGGTWLLRVQPGVRLLQVRKALKEKSFQISQWDEASVAALRDFRPGEAFFSPDPTETTASIGGMAACNASGARSYLYGATRTKIHALRVVLTDGSVTALERGVHRARGREALLPLTDGSTRRVLLPEFETPPIKDAGFYLRRDMDLVDLFMGSQGLFGIISELELELTPSPALLWGVTAFLPDHAAALRYVRALKGQEGDPLPDRPAAIEFFDRRALRLVEEQKAETPAFRQLQELPEDYNCAVYAEFNPRDPSLFLPTLSALSDTLRRLGGDPERTWVARNERELEKLLFFRHTVPETIDLIVEKNRKNDPCITILSTDMAVDDAHFETLFHRYERDLDACNMPCLLFGHIGENHVHPNLLARTREEWERGHRLFEEWAAFVASMGGTITAEHGAGKIKRKLEAIMMGPEKMAQLWELKRQLDPQLLLGPGNVLTEVEQ